jgi:purine-binding chemotaxis protein CheW
MDDVAIEAGDGAARQFVIFSAADELFAVPLAHVNEIIRYPAIVRVPLGSPSLEGLGNLRGAMLPILSFRRIIGRADVERTDATRIVVLNVDGRTVGLVVDRMANVVTVEADRMEPVAAIRSTIKTELLTGLIKNRDDGSMVMILDPRKIIAGDEKSDDGTAAAAATMVSASTGEAMPEIQLVSFMVAGQEYALPIERVQEIVQIPSAVTAVPNTDGHVLGVITLRDRLLPLMSLRSMLGLRDAELSDANKIVVVASCPCSRSTASSISR